MVPLDDWQRQTNPLWGNCLDPTPRRIPTDESLSHHKLKIKMQDHKRKQSCVSKLYGNPHIRPTKTAEGNGHVTEMMKKPFKYALRTGLDVF